MNLIFHQKEADKAYVSNQLWLPKSGITRVEPLKSALEFTVNTQNGQDRISMWRESRHHFVVPREFLPATQYTNYKFQFVDLRPEFEQVEFEDLVKTRDEEQERAWGAFSRSDNGILNLGCGKGKTKLAIKKIAQTGGPTLVVVPDGGILDQWRRAILGDATPGREQGPSIRFDGGLGLIQGGTFDWKHPVTLALVTTLWQRIEKDQVPEEMFRYFKLILYDEVHQIAAPKFSLTAPPFYGNRIGLTATVKREDGLDPIYLYHIGEPFYSDLKQDLVPRIYFQQTPISFDASAADINDTVNIGVLRTLLGSNYAANVYRYWCIVEAVEQGRKILCLSHSVAQLKLFHAMFPGSGLIIGDIDKDARLDIVRNSRICFAIAKLGSVGVDDDMLDTLFWMTPLRRENAIQQSMGRIQRERAGKKTPVMVFFEDWPNKTLRKMCQGIRSTLRKWHYKFEVLKPRPLPQQLPPQVKALYDDEFSRSKPVSNP